MYCSECGKAATKTKTRTINPRTRICNECEIRLLGNTLTGHGGARRRDSESATNTVNTPVIPSIPSEIANKQGNELTANDIYTIITTAIQGTNEKIDNLQKDIQTKMLEQKAIF